MQCGFASVRYMVYACCAILKTTTFFIITLLHGIISCGFRFYFHASQIWWAIWISAAENKFVQDIQQKIHHCFQSNVNVHDIICVFSLPNRQQTPFKLPNAECVIIIFVIKMCNSYCRKLTEVVARTHTFPFLISFILNDGFGNCLQFSFNLVLTSPLSMRFSILHGWIDKHVFCRVIQFISSSKRRKCFFSFSFCSAFNWDSNFHCYSHVGPVIFLTRFQ